jgi:hypothetical protein
MRFELISNREPLDATDEARAEPRHRACEIDVLESRQEMLESCDQLETSEVCTEAEVLAYSERQVRIGDSRDVEFKGLVEDLRIPIGRWVEERKRISLPDLGSAKLCVPGCGSGEVNERRGPP